MAFARVHRGAASAAGPDTSTGSTCARKWRALRAETVALRLRQLRQEALEAENQRLRTLATLRERLPERTLGAEVVARDWNGFTRGLTIDRGRVDGAERLAAVIVTSGVVGRVAVLRRQSAVVQVLTDPASSIGGVVLRTRAQGLVEGVAGGRLRHQAGRERGGAPAGRPRGHVRASASCSPRGCPWAACCACTRPPGSSARRSSSRRSTSRASRKSSSSRVGRRRRPRPGLPRVLSRATAPLRARGQRRGARPVHGRPGRGHRRHRPRRPGRPDGAAGAPATGPRRAASRASPSASRRTRWPAGPSGSTRCRRRCSASSPATCRAGSSSTRPIVPVGVSPSWPRSSTALVRFGLLQLFHYPGAARRDLHARHRAPGWV